MSQKEYALFQCARMILCDECPPDRKHYLCMKQEEHEAGDCTRCWDDFLFKVVNS